jgi:membrane protein
MAEDDERSRRLNIREFFRLLKGAAAEFSEDKVPRLSAALSYYTTFSLAPMLIIAIAVAGLVFDPGEVERAVLTQYQGLVGPEGGQFLETALAAGRDRGAGVVATVIGIGTLVFAALGAFGQLQDALNTIWEVQPKPNRGILGVVRDRLLSLTMVLVIGFLLLVALVLSAALAVLGNFLEGLLPLPEVVMQIINFVVTFSIITLLFGLMFKYLPDAVIAWRDVWVGAIITALLFTVGKIAIGLYLGNAAVTSAYGAAGSLVVLLLWVYYSAMIFFFGAEFTQVYANRFGSRVVPADNAMPVGEAEREQQGIPHRQPGAAAGAAAGVPILREPIEVQPRSVTLLEAPASPPLNGREVLMALLTFAAGLGAGALVAAQSLRERAKLRPIWRRPR